MNKVEIIGIDYARNVFNKMLSESGSQSRIRLVWNTSFGLAYLTTVQMDGYNNPVISETIDYDSVLQEVIRPREGSEKNIFYAIRHAMFNEFHRPFGWVKLNLIDRPDLLLARLSDIVKSALSDDLRAPDYQSVWEFKKLDGSISLPFISNDQIEIFGVASLTLESSTDTE